MGSKPTDRASDLMETVDHAHARLRRAWSSRPDGDLRTSTTATGRIVSSRIPDPASDAADQHLRLRDQVLATVAELTADLAGCHAIDANPDLVFSCRRMRDVLALHKQYSAALLTRIRQLQADPTKWDDAKNLTGTLAFHTRQIDATSRWAYGALAQPDADPGIRVCEGRWCQRVAVENSRFCREHRAREERRAQMAENRRRQVRADRANGLRCWGEIRPCDAMLSDADRDRNRTNCGACRTHASRTVGTAGAFRWHDPVGSTQETCT